MKKYLGLVFLTFLVTIAANAQPKEITRFFPVAATGASPNLQNLQYILDGYVGQTASDLGGVLNGGWYNTAENHKRFGFDLSLTMSTVFVASSSQYFNVDNTQLNGVGYLGSTSGFPMPTAYGPENEIPAFTINSGPNTGATFNGPGGGSISKEIPIGSLAVPTIQGGLGLFANTDLRFRFTPNVKIGSTQVSNWGAGLMHDIKQHIPGMKELPFSLSLLLAYSSMTTTTDFTGVYETSSGSGSFAGQEGVAETTAFTAQVLISKSIPVLTFYGGLGYNSGNTKYSVNGNYYVDEYYTVGGPIPLNTPIALSNPFNQQYSSNGFRFTGGIRLKFGPVFLNGDYTFFGGQGYLSTGFGFTVR